MLFGDCHEQIEYYTKQNWCGQERGAYPPQIVYELFSKANRAASQLEKSYQGSGSSKLSRAIADYRTQLESFRKEFNRQFSSPDRYSDAEQFRRWQDLAENPDGFWLHELAFFVENWQLVEDALTRLIAMLPETVATALQFSRLLARAVFGIGIKEIIDWDQFNSNIADYQAHLNEHSTLLGGRCLDVSAEQADRVCAPRNLSWIYDQIASFREWLLQVALTFQENDHPSPPGYLGIIFHDADRSITRTGFSQSVKLAELPYQILKIVARCGGRPCPMEIISQAWGTLTQQPSPGNDCIYDAVRRLNKGEKKARASSIATLHLKIANTDRKGWRVFDIANVSGN